MLANVEIRHVGGIATEVIVDGQDVSNMLSVVTYQHRAGEAPKLILEMVPGTFNLASNACKVEEKP
ncbi:hypothetical protein D1156_11900 [Neglecta sp. X58]|jgi:hypothetical protein|nr:hypothetical protein [Neglectibacter sp. X58]NCE81747.1 hypothetical protein [Neglectibacter sp. X58]